MPYNVDQTVFHSEGAVISWTAAAQRLNIPLFAPLPTVVELRWMLTPKISACRPNRSWCGRAGTQRRPAGRRSRSRSSSSCSSDWSSS